MHITLNELLFSLSRALDFVEHELLGVTTNHGKRTAYLSMRLAKSMGCTEPQIFDMASCAVLHDNALTSYMLEKGRDSDIARLESLEIHCELGENNARDFPFLGDVKGVILQHHENWNGTGYHKVAGKDIPLRAAILRLTDNMDLRLKLGLDRPTLDSEIREHIHRFKGTLYAPDVVDALDDILDDELISNMSDETLDHVLGYTVPAVGRDLSTAELLQVCRIFAMIIDSKSPFTQNHSRGISRKAAYMGRLYGFDQEHCDKLRIAGFLHDVGKLSTPLSILEKPGPLDRDEFEVMKRHAAVTWEILQDVKGLEEITVWGGNHHEKLDGSGYPHGFSEPVLDFESRLMTCCDIYQALTEDRPYRPGMTHEQAVAIMRDMASQTMIDGDIVEKMAKELADVEALAAALV